jgi:hypothetical protein
MTMRNIVALLSLGLLTAGCSAPTAEVPAPVTGSFKAIASVQELMRTLTIPSSSAIFAAQGEAPQDESGWSAVLDSALVLAESGNLLMLGERARDAGDWRKHARALTDAAAGAVTAARAKNNDQLGKAADAIYMACEACHEKYLPK